MLDGFAMFNGMRVVTSIHLTKPFEDWSGVRSPSRARRRMKQGHRQRVRTIYVPDPDIYQMGGALHMHPETLRKLHAALEPPHE